MVNKPSKLNCDFNLDGFVDKHINFGYNKTKI